MITDRETGRSRGFGFITFSDDDAASQAVSEMDGVEMDGRTIKVSFAEERRPGARTQNRSFGGGSRNNRW